MTVVPGLVVVSVASMMDVVPLTTLVCFEYAELAQILHNRTKIRDDEDRIAQELTELL